jgi:hypothetical protein
VTGGPGFGVRSTKGVTTKPAKHFDFTTKKQKIYRAYVEGQTLRRNPTKFPDGYRKVSVSLQKLRTRLQRKNFRRFFHLMQKERFFRHGRNGDIQAKRFVTAVSSANMYQKGQGHVCVAAVAEAVTPKVQN